MASSRTLLQWERICLEGVHQRPYPGSSPGEIPVSGLAWVNTWIRDLVNPGLRILDVGSGHARVAIGLDLFGVPVDYLGIDPIPSAISFSRQAFEGVAGFRFKHWDVKNGRYNPTGKLNPESAKFPVPETSCDLLIMSSVLTHVGTMDVAGHYLDEAARVLVPGGHMLVSVFTDPPNRSHSGTDRTVLSRDWFRHVMGHSFETLRECGGTTQSWNDQTCYLVRRKHGE